MNTVLVDTSALVAIANKRDFYYKQAEIVHKELIFSSYAFLTHNFVLTEFLNYFCQANLKSLAVRIINTILKKALKREVVREHRDFS